MTYETVTTEMVESPNITYIVKAQKYGSEQTYKTRSLLDALEYARSWREIAGVDSVEIVRSETHRLY